ncbi:hypothetical protein T4B_11051 [Trichinella pseudospiralis]|uniref:Uncharacterized protein n=2 Tax=Trichinella pseudospiralis TaxID=6337 RepID=A0A0V1DKW2_TRIPS|nr:hypothetical protein T4D_14728 [Trichinella pseudospiralis]KRY94494.1 hypothetical protein T4B_11051 [Trichinella pseudospiralis]
MNCALNGRRINFEETKLFLREEPQFQCSSCDECKAYRMKLAGEQKKY